MGKRFNVQIVKKRRKLIVELWEFPIKTFSHYIVIPSSYTHIRNTGAVVKAKSAVQRCRWWWWGCFLSAFFFVCLLATVQSSWYDKKKWRSQKGNVESIKSISCTPLFYYYTRTHSHKKYIKAHSFLSFCSLFSFLLSFNRQQ